MKNRVIGTLILGLATGLSIPAVAQEATRSREVQAEQGKDVKIPTGEKQKIKGVIVNRNADSFLMRDLSGGDVQVNLTNITKVEEKKGNPFRRAKNYGTTQLLRGLTVEVEGRGDGTGALVADKVKMTDEALVVARTVETRVTPVEGRVGDAETRLTQAETNAQRLSGQLEELAAISNAARGGAKAAQETADMAMAGVENTNKRIDSLVTGLDEYEAKRGITVNFKVGSYRLSPEAKSTLDEIANQAKSERAYVIEITGYASADGNENLNRRLSRQRADAVVQYLAENHMIPLRRIVTPFGYGEAQPVADNTTREGRQENRRVEVKILVNKGMTAPAPSATMSRPNTGE
ncbi:MAG TPA: OmpA family protein [Blastocatellia bacterium]|nr:OmpA family protein [Blastocatellia bacterium]